MTPLVMLGILLALLATGGGSFLYGQHVQKAEDAAAEKDQIVQAISDYDEIAEAEKKRVVAQAVARTRAEQDAANLQGAGDESIRKNPLAANCDWDVATFELLLSSVKAAGGASAADKPGVPDAVRRTVPPTK